jgi:hypothetical protein
MRELSLIQFKSAPLSRQTQQEALNRVRAGSHQPAAGQTSIIYTRSSRTCRSADRRAPSECRTPNSACRTSRVLDFAARCDGRRGVPARARPGGAALARSLARHPIGG